MDADPSDVSDLTSLGDDVEYQDVGDITGKARNESPLTEVEDNEDNDSTHSGPFTPRRTTQRPTNGSSPSKIGAAIARPIYNASIRTYGGRRRDLRGEAATKAPEIPPKPSTSAFVANTQFLGESSLTPLRSPRKRRAAADARRASSSTKAIKRRRERTSDADGTDRRVSAEPTSITASSPSKRRALRITGAANGAADQETGDIAIISSARAKRRQTPINQNQSESSISVSAPASARQRKGVNAKERALLFDKFKLGSPVWVRIDARNNPTDDPLETAFWWPGKVASIDELSNCVKVDIHFSPALDLPQSRLKILSPSPNLILPKEDAKITITNYNLPTPNDSSEATDQSEVDSHIKNRWASAFMHAEREDNAVDKPEGTLKGRRSETSASAVHPRSIANGLKGTKRKKVDKAPESVLNDNSWKPPSADETVQVPGELVLAKEKRSKTLFYPAKVIRYEPPQNPKAQPLYVVKFMDNFVGSIPRECFYIYEQEEFGTCKLGQYQSVESRHDGDTVDDTIAELSAMVTSDVVIPDPTLPTPSRSELYDLPMLNQVAYVVPVLSCIIDDKYGPAKAHNKDYLKGGRRREALTKQAPPKGELTRQEYEELGHIVKNWALGLKADSQSSSAHLGTNDHRRSESDAHPNGNMPRDVQEATSRPNGTSENSISVITERNSKFATSPEHGEVGSSPSSQAVNEPPDDHGLPTLPPSSLPVLSPLSSVSDNESCGASEPSGESNAARTSAPSIPRILNNLSDQEKINYCTDVLLREAVIQLLLWRNGLRSDLNILDDAEEIMELRDKKEKIIQANNPQKSTTVSGTRSRPKCV